jgi:hypothetical protein
LTLSWKNRQLSKFKAEEEAAFQKAYQRIKRDTPGIAGIVIGTPAVITDSTKRLLLNYKSTNPATCSEGENTRCPICVTTATMPVLTLTKSTTLRRAMMNGDKPKVFGDACIGKKTVEFAPSRPLPPTPTALSYF